jgi:hypothetical protein
MATVHAAIALVNWPRHASRAGGWWLASLMQRRLEEVRMVVCEFARSCRKAASQGSRRAAGSHDWAGPPGAAPCGACSVMACRGVQNGRAEWMQPPLLLCGPVACLFFCFMLRRALLAREHVLTRVVCLLCAPFARLAWYGLPAARTEAVCSDGANGGKKGKKRASRYPRPSSR